MTISLDTRRAAMSKILVGTALLSPLALASRDMLGKAAAGSSAGNIDRTVDEMRYWNSHIGQVYSLSAFRGTVNAVLTHVSAAKTGGPRPVASRRHSFWAHFSLDAADAPDGNEVYKIAHPIMGVSELFMIRSTDQAGRAVLKALFN